MSLRSRSWILLFAGALFTGLIFSPVVHADNTLVLNDLLSRGKETYKNNDYKEAQGCFLKALTIAPDNDEAKEYLQKMGVRKELYDTTFRPRVLNQEEVVTYQHQLDSLRSAQEAQAKVNAALREDQKLFQQRLQAKREKEAALDQQLSDIKEQAAQETAKQQALIAEKEKALAQKEEEAHRLDYDLKRTKNDLEQKQALLAERDEQLKDLGKKISALSLTSEKDKVSLQTQVANLEGRIALYKEQSSRNTREQNQRLDELQDNLRKKIIELGYLNDKLVVSNYKLDNTGSEVSLKNLQINELRASLKDLETDLNYYQKRVKALEGRPAVTSNKYPEGYLDKLALLRKQDAAIGELKEKLASTKKQAAALQQIWASGKIDDKKLKSLQGEIAVLKDQLKEKEDALKEREENYKLISDQLQETKKQLMTTQGMTAAPDADKEPLIPAEMEKKLNDVLGQ